MPPTSRISGFTLVEMLIALVLTGIIGAAIFDFLMRQGRFGAYQAGQQEATQNARGVAELLGSELRGVVVGSLGAPTGNLSYRMPLVWGVVCGPGTATEILVAFPQNALAGVSSPWGLDAPRHPDLPETHAQERVFGAGSSMTAATCTDHAPGATTVRRITLSQALPNALPVFTPVYLYQQIEYAVAPDAALGGNWLKRKVGTGSGATFQPLAGPIRRFQVEHLKNDGTSAGAGEQGRIRITVVTESRNKPVSGAAVSDSLSTVISLRNQTEP
jgi:prepilin-type N-terminal cleavage/methylation domain-containing protein